MPKEPIRAIPSPVQSEIPVYHISLEVARKAWDEYQSLCMEETAIREKRQAAYAVFYAAFMAGAE